jgi:hypothetical protein
MRAIRIALLVLIGGAAYIHAQAETRDRLPVPRHPWLSRAQARLSPSHGVAAEGAALLEDKRSASFGDGTSGAEAAKRAIAAISQLR